MSFWDIDDFLAEEQKIQSCFNKQAIGMQFLDPTKGRNGNLDASQQFQTPIWVLNNINDYLPQMQENDYLKVNFPQYLHSKQFENRVNSFLVNTTRSSLMKHQATKFDRKLVGSLLRPRGKYILISASAYVGNLNTDLALNTFTQFQMQIYKITKNIIQSSNSWKYSHKWFDQHNSLQKMTKK